MPAVEFPDLAEFLDPAFTLPYRGKAYRVPAPDAKTGIYLQSLMDAGESLLVTRSITAANKTILADDAERTAYQMAMGDAYAEMLADKVPFPVLKRAGITAMLYWTRGPELALAFWQAGSGNREAPEAGADLTSSDTPPTGP